MKASIQSLLALAACTNASITSLSNGDTQQPLGECVDHTLLAENARLQERIHELEHSQPQQWPIDTLVPGQVYVANWLAGPAYIEVFHTRGDGDQIDDQLSWDEVVPASKISSEKTVWYQSLRTDWDNWSVSVRFGKAFDRFMWSKQANCSISLYDVMSNGNYTTVELVKGGLVKFWPAGRPSWGALTECQAEFAGFSKTSEYNINAFTFIHAYNGLNHDINVTVTLSPGLKENDGARQSQSAVITKSGEPGVLPFFFEFDPQKSYEDQWVISIAHNKRNNWESEPFNCTMQGDVIGDAIPLNITKAGWQLGGGGDCKGEWD